MKPDYLTLGNDRSVRILWNMNTLSELTRLTEKEMTAMAEGKADIDTFRTIAWSAAREGEEADGRELGLTEIEFGRLLTMSALVEFAKILTKQSSNEGQKKTPEEKGRFPRVFFRSKG